MLLLFMGMTFLAWAMSHYYLNRLVPHHNDMIDDDMEELLECDDDDTCHVEDEIVFTVESFSDKYLMDERRISISM